MTQAEELTREIERLFNLMVKRRLTIAEPVPQLTPSQRLALALVVDEGPMRLGVLAEAMGTTDPTATRTVDALEAGGLAARADDPDDRRAVLIASTPAGRRLLARARRRFAQLLQEPLGVLAAPDRRRLVELLEELNRELEREGARGRRAAAAR